MKKFLTFFASLFSLTLLLVALFGQPIVNAEGEAKVSLNFTEEDGNFSVFSGNSYSTTKNVEVEVSGKQDESAIIEISFNATELVVTGVDGVKSDEYSTPEKGLLRIITTKNNFTINFKIADESLDVYGVPFVGEVAKLQVGNTRYASEENFYFTRGYYGDLNLDGNINLLDYAYMRTILLGNDVTAGGNVVDVKKLADINHDGYVDFDDYNYLYTTVKEKEGSNDLETKTFSDQVYCTVTYVQEGKESYNEAHPFGTEVNGEKLTGDVEVKVENVVSEYKVVYFFSTAVNSTPVVDYAVAGEKLELIVPNGTNLINGYIRWYSYELNASTGKYEMVPVTDDYVMPNKDLYLYAQYSNQYFPLLVYKLNDSVYGSFEFDFFDVVTVDEINAINSAIDWNSAILEGYQFGGWYFDEECITPVEDFQILADTYVYAKLEPKTYQVTFVKDNGDDNTVENVKFNEKIDELEVIKPGYIFLGWYEENATEPFDFANSKMPAKSIVLNAKWLDVVKDAAQNINNYLAEVGVQDLAKVEYNENLTEVNDLTLVLDLDAILGFDKANVNVDVLKGILNSIADYCGTTYTEDVVASLQVNGYNVYSNGVFNVDAIQSAVVSVAGNLPEAARLVLNGNRNVTVNFELTGSEENLDKFAEIVESLANHISLSYDHANNQAVVDVLVPQSVVNALEERAKDAGKTIEDIINELTVKDVLLALQELYAQNVSAEQEELINKVALLVIEELLSTELVSGSSIKVTIGGYGVNFTTNATTVSELIAELVSADSQLGELLNVKLGTYNVNGVYEIPMTFDVTLPDLPQLDTTDASLKVLVRVAWNSVPHTITFEGNGADSLEVNGAAGNTATDIFGTEVYTNATKEGYVFVGWYDNAEFLGEPVSNVDQDDNVFVTIPHSDKTYYAKWETVKYQITYDMMDDERDPAENDENAPLTYTVEDGAVTLLDATRPHYTFAGWYATADYSTPEVVTIDVADAEDKVLYAKWTPVAYEIHYTGDRSRPESGFFARDYYTLIDLTEIYESANFSIEKQGNDIVGWEWVYLTDKDDLTVQPNVVVSGETFNIDGDILVWATYKPQTATITFDANNGDVTPDTKEVVFGEAYGELPVPTRRGYEFVGWFLGNVEVTAETIYNTYVTDPSSPDYFNAKNVTLKAKWEVIDVVADATEGIEEVIDEVLVLEDGVQFPVVFENETEEFTNLDDEKVVLVNKVTVKVNLDDLADIKSYRVNDQYLNKDNIVEGLKGILAVIVKDAKIINDITVNGHLVYADGKFQNDGLGTLAQELTYSLVDDLANGNVPTFNVLVDDAVCERNVEVLLVLEGSQDKLDKVEEIAAKLQNHVKVEFNDKVELTINVPQSIVKKFEAKIVEEYSGVTLEEVLNNITIEGALNIFVNEAEDILSDNPEVLDAIAQALFKGKDLINKVYGKALFDATVNGDKLFVDDAEFAPASDSFADVVKALMDVINPELLATPLADLNVENNGIYTFPLFLTADLTEFDKFTENVINIDALVHIVFDSSEYTVELDANGGEFENGNSVVYENGVVGEALVAVPSRDLYTFVGWVDENGVEYSAIPNKDITLYAQWEAREYKINYIVNDGNYDGTFDLDYYVTDVKETSEDVVEVLAEGYNVNSVFVMAEGKSVEGYYQFAGWKIGEVELTEVVNGNVQFVANAQELIFAELAKLDAQDDTIVLTAMWTNTPFEVQFLYPNGVVGAVFDKYYTEYDSNDNPIASSVKDIVYKSEIVINNLITKDNAMSFAEIGKTQVGWAWKLADADDSTYAELDLDATLQVVGNITIKPAMIGRTIEVKFDTLGGTIAPEQVYIIYDTYFDQLAVATDGEYNTALSTYVPEKDGYVFKGWYYGTTLITDETLAKGSAADELNYNLDSITLTAEWVDIYQDALNNLKEAADSVVPGLLESEETYDAENLLEKILVKVDVDNLFAGNISVDDELLVELLGGLVEYVSENYTTVDTLLVNGVVVYDNNLIVNEGLANAFANYMTDIETDSSITLVAECGTVTRILVVEFAYKDGTSQENINLINDVYKAITDVVSINYHTGEITVTVPAEIVADLEKLASQEGLTVEDYLADWTIAEVVAYIYEEYTDQEFKDNAAKVYDVVVSYLEKYEAEITNIINSGIITSDNVTSVDGLVSIVDMTLDQFYDSALSTGDNVVYSGSIEYAFDASAIAPATAPYETSISLTLVLTKNKYAIEFYETDVNGEPFLLETIENYVGEFATPASPSRVGYSFEGWYSVLQESYDVNYGQYLAETIHANETVKLYAHFSQNDVVITYDPNNGENISVDDDSFGTAYDLINTVPTRKHYDFLGWTTTKDDASTLLTSTSMISNPENHTLYALWEETTYCVTFVANGGSGLDVNDLPQDKIGTSYFTINHTAAAINDLINGLSDVNNVIGFTASWPTVTDTDFAEMLEEGYAAADKTVYISAIYTINTYTVTFKADGKVIDTVEYNVKMDAVTEPVIPAKDGYVAEYEAYALDKTAPADLVVNTIYTEKVFNLVFDINGGVFNEVETDNKTITIKYNQVLYFADVYASVYNAGHAFAGWYYEDGTVSVKVIDEAKFNYADIIKLDSNSTVTLVAEWANVDYNVAFNVDAYSYTFGKIAYGSEYVLTGTYAFPTDAATAKVFTYDRAGNEVAYQREAGVDLVLDLVTYDPTDAANKEYYTITVYNYIVVRFYDANGNLI